MVVLMGPDGCGKTSVLDGLEEELAPLFRQVHRFHLRPERARVPRKVGDAADPQGQEPRGQMASFAKLGLWLSDYLVGYLIDIYPKMLQSRLILFDRYYDDILIDERRYRYGGPKWLLKSVWRLIPRPDILILLDAPADVLQARKSEVSYLETARQRNAYLEHVRGLEYGLVVDATRPLPEVISDVKRTIVEHLEARTAGPGSIV
jgi:thymidylate kinase